MTTITRADASGRRRVGRAGRHIIPADGSEPIDFTESLYGDGLVQPRAFVLTTVCTNHEFDVLDGVLIPDNTVHLGLLN